MNYKQIFLIALALPALTQAANPVVDGIKEHMAEKELKMERDTLIADVYIKMAKKYCDGDGLNSKQCKDLMNTMQDDTIGGLMASLLRTFCGNRSMLSLISSLMGQQQEKDEDIKLGEIYHQFHGATKKSSPEGQTSGAEAK
jgi:hypothetical protein